jgi:hypothetical protein
MKYFNNTPYTAETLKNEYRELCKKLHPDTGGDAEQFKIMLNEYNSILNIVGTRANNTTDTQADNMNGTPLRGTRGKTFADLVARLVEVFTFAEMLQDYNKSGDLSECFGWDGCSLSPLSRTAYINKFGRVVVEMAEEAARRYMDQHADEVEQNRREREAERQAEQRQREEERRREEEEKRREAERIAKAQAETAAKVTEWADRLERVKNPGGKIYHFNNDKDRAAFVATTKRNIKAVINHYFPGLKVTVTISGEIYKEKFIINWVDGPSADTLRATCKELFLFVPTFYASDPYADYGSHYERKESAPWREAYGQALGDVDDFDTARTLSEEGRQEAEQAAAAIFAHWNEDTDHGRGTFTASHSEWCKFAELLGVQRDKYGCLDFYKSGMTWSRYANNERSQDGQEIGDIYYSSARKLLREKFNVTAQSKEKAPEFAPKYGATYKAIKKALGGNVFYMEGDTNSSRDAVELSIFEAAEKLAKGEAVKMGKRSEFDGEACIYGTDRGGRKVQEKRAEKFEAVGVILEAATFRIYGTVQAVGIKPETLAALRREAAEIKQQRKEWEAKQAEPKTAQAEPTEATTEPAQVTEWTEAPAEGLQLEEIPGGVAVTGDSRTTYKHRKAIKGHGCTWNREAQRWEATNSNDAAKVRAWFLMRDGFDTPEPKTDEEIKTEAAAEISEEENARQFADAFATIAATMTAAATAQPEPQAEPETATAAPQRDKILFNPDDCPELDAVA